MAEGDVEPQAPRPDGRDSQTASRWLLLTLVILCIGTGYMMRDVLAEGGALVSKHRMNLSIVTADVTFEAWLVARNAHTLLRQPHRIFDTEHCAPDDETLTLGIPMITMGLLGIPATFVTDDPTLIYNFAIAAMTVIFGLAMYLLVSDWTRCPPAGIVAALLYAFNPSRLTDIQHPSVWDTSWLVLALYFSQRLFAKGRWRDAIGLAVACSLQIGASFYPLLASALLTPLYIVWLLRRDGFRHIRPAQMAFIWTLVLLITIWWLGPYLDARASPEAERRELFTFVRWAFYAPGNLHFPGYAALVLGFAGIFAPARYATAGIVGNPRWALIAGAIFVVLVAAGEHSQDIAGWFFTDPSFQMPNLYGLLSRIIPGLDAVRGVMRLTAALQVVICILAGMGAAWLIGVSRGWATPTICALLVFAWCTVLGLSAIGIDPPHARLEVVHVDARPASVAFHRKLTEMGNQGPILELPPRVVDYREADRVYLIAHHGRRTSACFGSYSGLSKPKLIRLAEALPARKVVETISRLGFTTLIIHHTSHSPASDDKLKWVAEYNHRWAAKLASKVERQKDGPLKLLYRTPDLTAYEILETPPQSDLSRPSDG